MADSLANAVRALVRDELNQTRQDPPPERPPSWKDAFWLLALVCDIVLLVALIPEDLWENPALEEIGKLLPWIGGGTFVLGTTWFRGRLLVFSRGNGFKVVTAIAFFPLFLLQLPFIPLRPVIAPTQSQLFVDGVRKGGNFGDGKTVLWLKARTHTFKILPDVGGESLAREIEWNWLRLFKMWLTGRQPRWAILYHIPLITDGTGCLVRISKADGNLDTDFEDDLLTIAGNSWEFKPADTVDEIQLPYGDYNASVTKDKCKPLSLQEPVRVGADSKAKIMLNNMGCSK